VLFVLADAVGACGVPVRLGEAIGAYMEYRDPVSCTAKAWTKAVVAI